MKEYSKFKCQPCGNSANRHNRIHSLECDLGGTVEGRSGWRKVRDLVQLLVSRVLSLGAKSRLCFCMCKHCFCCMDVRRAQLKKKMWSACRGMMQGWLEGYTMLDLRTEFLQMNLRLD